jgi:hypothetical protein
MWGSKLVNKNSKGFTLLSNTINEGLIGLTCSLANISLLLTSSLVTMAT